MNKKKKNETVDERRKRLSDEKKERQLKKRKKRLAVLAIVLSASLAIGGAVYGVKVYLDNTGYFMRKQTSMSTKNYTIDNAVMSFFVNDAYLTYLERNKDYLSQYGLDINKPLDEQYQTKNLTWRDYFIETARDSVEKMLIMAEAAENEGVTLSKEEIDEIEKSVDELDLKKYGKGVKKEDALTARKLYNLALKYDNQLYSGLRFTEEEVNSYYEENKMDYLYFDYRYYTFSYSSEEGKLNKSDAEAYAKEMANCKSEEEFISKIKEHALREAPDATEEELGYEVSDRFIEKTTYQEDDDLSTWVFESDRQVGDILLSQSDDYNTYTVYYLCKLPAKDTSPTVNVRHILFLTETYGSEDAAYSKATEVLNDWKAGAHTEETFANLASKYSEDPGSVANGGLYQNITNGELVEEFNDWCFAPERYNGETAIVKTEYGQHIIYYIGKGLEQWQISIYNLLVDTAYEEKCNEFSEKYRVTIDNDIMKKVAF